MPDWITNRLPLTSCGVEDLGVERTFDADARSCLLAAHQRGSGAELISNVVSIEGDPITRYLRVHDNGVIELFVDATRDRYGSGRWERLRCDRLVPVAEANDPPDVVHPLEMVFVEDGCEELPVP
ncbi:MAG: DUF4362 domain-containing protein [Chloroflexota bacterium]|nr:DUF4362 domain-containing protein [Chloroflexota bacterium]